VEYPVTPVATGVLPAPSCLGRVEAALDSPSGAVAEACTLNLIAVVGDRSDLIEQVARELLSRTFVVRRAADRAPWSLEATVRAIECSDCAAGEPVRTVYVELTCGDRVAAAARSVLIHLIEPRLRTVLFLAPQGDPVLSTELMSLADHLVTDCVADSRRTLELVARGCPTVADVSLLRTLRWRELVARFFDDASNLPAARAIESIEVVQVPDATGGLVVSELLVSWIGAQLGWHPSPAGLTDASGRAVSVILRGAELPEVVPGSLQQLQVVAGGVRGCIRRAPNPKELLWTLEASGQPVRSATVPAALPSPVRLVTRTLATPNRDPAAADTLRFLARWKGIA